MHLRFKNKNLVLICLIFLGAMISCKAQNNTETAEEYCFKTAADRPQLYLPLLKDKTVTVVTNQTGLLKDKTHLVDFLVKNNIKFDQIICEFNSWVHIAWKSPTGKQRGQILTAKKINGKTKYLAGLVK